jgi:hypothetical protein
VPYSGTPKNVRLALGLAPRVTLEPVVRKVFLIGAPVKLPLPSQVVEGVMFGNNGEAYRGELVSGGGYPIEDDVRLGIDYGQFEGEFTGNIVLPAEADVKLGVDYGANGTEFEGELTGGGGGVSRGRVVNP